MSDTWKIILGVALAIFLLPKIWALVSVTMGILFGLLQLALVAAIVIFIIGLVRRMGRV